MIFFSKMHGLGNDYIFINCLDERNKIENEKLPQISRYFSNRNFGIGGDGIILIEKSDIADFKMRIFNSDGSEAQMCGNGIRCFAKFVYENKMINRDEIKIETMAGIKTAYIRNSRINKDIQEITIDMGIPIFQSSKIPVKCEVEQDNIKLILIELQILDNKITAYTVSMGNPHTVIISNDIENIDIKTFGKLIENDIHFPEKTNVEFIKILDRGNIKMRVWERGSGETFACGTGACATAVICNKLGLTRKDVKVHLKGGELKIYLDDKSGKVFMTGTATKVFDGCIDENVVLG